LFLLFNKNIFKQLNKKDSILNSKIKSLLIYSAIIGGAGLLTPPVYAGTETMLELLKVLRDRGTIRQDEFEMLRNAAKADEEKETSKQEQREREIKQATVTAANSKEKDSEKDSAGIKLGENGLEIESRDGNFKAEIGGRLQVDSQVNFNDENGPLNTHLYNGMNIRRARIHVGGTFFKDFNYKFEYDFVRAGNNPTAAGITDAWLKYTHFKPFSITVGQFKEPFSLASVTSNRFLTFIERPLPNNAFVEFPNPYKLGISAESYGTKWTARAAFQTENSSRNPSSGDASYEAIGRVTFLPIYNGPTQILHLGAAGAYTWVNNTFDPATGELKNKPLIFASQPYTNVDRTPWVTTGPLTTKLGPGHKELDSVTRFGAELAGVYGPFSFQSEYTRANLSGTGYSGDDVLEGYYAYVSYFLTGESRVYDNKAGKFDRLKPKHNFDLSGGWGAWEIAARWDQLDMNTENVNGGNIQTATVGLNWYLNSHVRFMANYGYVVNVDTRAANPAIAKFNNLNPSILEFRTQIDW
jgi:phosphate-selective porin OprO/OprP